MLSLVPYNQVGAFPWLKGRHLVRMSPEMHIQPTCTRLYTEEFLWLIRGRYLIKFDSIILELYFRAFSLAYQAETHSQICVVRVQLQRILVIFPVILDEAPSFLQLWQVLVEVLLDIGPHEVLDLSDNGDVCWDIKRLVLDTRSRAVQAIGRLVLHSLRGGHLIEGFSSRRDRYRKG